MKKILLFMLVVLFMSCSLETKNTGLQGSWYNVEDKTFTNYVFTDELSISKTNNGIRGTVVYDYYSDGDFIYILLNNNYEKAFEIVDIADDKLTVVSIINDETLVFKRD